MRTPDLIWLPLIAILGSACDENSDPPFLETKYVRYVSELPLDPCGGLAKSTDEKVEHLFDRLDEPYPPPLSILYKWVADDSTLICSPNPLGCARLTPEGPVIASTELAVSHELAHAVHFFALGYTHPLLSEGLATYETEGNQALSLVAIQTFGTDIESFITLGDVPGDQYHLAAQFAGATLERHGLAAFKKFWQQVTFSTTLDEFRTAYEAQYDESWSDALVRISEHRSANWPDRGCEGDAQVIGAEGLHLMVTETCEDATVFGPVRSGGAPAGMSRIPVEIPNEGSYRFAFVHPGEKGDVAAYFRGCQVGGPAPGTPLTAFFVQGDPDEQVALMGAGRYLLSVRVPLTAGGEPVEVRITPEG